MIFATPSVRNLVWNAALVACTVAPLAWMVGPRVRVPVPDALLQAGSVVQAPHEVAAAQHDPVERASTSAHDSPDWKPLIALIWLAGALFFAVRSAGQVRLARRLVRRGRPATHPELDTVLAGARAVLGIRGYVAVLESADIDVPVATGLLKPAILLPESSREWPRHRVRIVLLHELAHVRRGDVWGRMLAMFACTLQWFNPVIWALSELARRDAELAADDLVLAAGVRASSYADTLLSFAESLLPSLVSAEPAMPLIRRKLLEHRVYSILRESRPQREVSMRARVGALTSSCALAALAACVQLVPRASHEIAYPVSESGVSGGAASSPVPFVQPTPATTSAASQSKAKTVIQRTAVSPTAGESNWIPGATAGLIAALYDSSPQVRGEAAHALGNLRALTARDPLSRLLNDPDKFVQYETQLALSRLDSPR